MSSKATIMLVHGEIFRMAFVVGVTVVLVPGNFFRCQVADKA